MEAGKKRLAGDTARAATTAVIALAWLFIRRGRASRCRQIPAECLPEIA